MQEKIYDEWNKPEYIKIDAEEYQRDQEKLEYYESTIDYIKDTLKEYLLKERTIDEAIDEIGIIIRELEDEIN